MITRRFPSASSDAVYTAMITDASLLSCDCRGWTMKRPGKPRHCKHTKELAAGRATVERDGYVYLADAAPAQRFPYPSSVEGAVKAKPKAPAKAAPQRGPQAAGASAPPASLQQPPAPMLASAMVAPLSGAAFDRAYASGWVMEQKIDGHRCIASVQDGRVLACGRPHRDGARPEKRLPANIVEQLRRFPNGVYDGELVEVTAGKSWNVSVLGAQLVFVIFDVVELLGQSIASWRYADRRDALLEILAAMPDGQTAITTVVADPPTWAGVEALWSRGAEGAILKRVTSTYRVGHRSPDWIKVKEVHAATLTLVAFEAAKNGPYATMLLRGADGMETTIKTPDNATLRAVAAAPKAYVGRQVVISFQERTPSGSYRHPMFDHWAGEGERDA